MEIAQLDQALRGQLFWAWIKLGPYAYEDAEAVNERLAAHGYGPPTKALGRL